MNVNHSFQGPGLPAQRVNKEEWKRLTTKVGEQVAKKNQIPQILMDDFSVPD